MAANLTVIIPAKNEEHNIARVLTSVGWSSEVIVIDSGSADRTVAIASSFANTKLIQTEWLGYTKTKQLGIDAASNEWILWLDADEEVMPELAKSIQYFLLRSDLEKIAGARIKRLSFIGTKAIYHSGWYPGLTLRLFHRRRAVLVDRAVHEYVEPLSKQDNRVEVLDGDLRHYSYPDFESYFRKSVQYAVLSSLELRKSGQSFSISKMILHPVGAILRQYFLKLGFLDGVEGLLIAVGSAYGRFVKYAMLHDRKS
jgi:(heptosyl)LPS beta-1,4-glucosyltransferase